jgi:glycerophosphoryl diester phosphodiesterase
MTSDGVPVLSHDAHLLKLTGKQIIIADHSYDEIKDMSAGYADRFGDKFSDCRIATLRQFSQLLKDWPDVRCFIELKEPSLNNFGMKAVDLMMDALADILPQVIIISFDADAIRYTQQNYDVETGWVLPEWSQESYSTAVELAPRYLFVDAEFCPQQQSEIWSGVWEWAVYTINTADEVEHFAGLGIELIETNRFSELKQESSIVDVSNDF